MTATPIPRTLGQVLYADLDVSDLRRRPCRAASPTRTGIRGADRARRAPGSRCARRPTTGHRTFVVVPHIDPQATEGERRRWHGCPWPCRAGRRRLAAARRAPRRWPSGCAASSRRCASASSTAGCAPTSATPRWRASATAQLDVLVGTTVVEVGVDVPEATMMIVLEADRFGLSQLHQLRGRVGRGSAASYCVLVADVAAGSVARASASRPCASTNDGFVLAEKDWAAPRRGRRPGPGPERPAAAAPRLAGTVREDQRARGGTAATWPSELLDDDGRLPPELRVPRRRS